MHIYFFKIICKSNNKFNIREKVLRVLRILGVIKLSFNRSTSQKVGRLAGHQ